MNRKETKTKFRILWVVVGLALLMALACWFVSPPPEPAYEGFTLRAWSQVYAISTWRYSAEWKKADEAVRHIGTNAIPTLLRLLRVHDGSLKRNAVYLVERFLKVKYTTPRSWNTGAAECFRPLGASASNAVPALMEIYERHYSDDSQECVVQALGYIGPGARAAVPVLLRAMNHPQAMVRGRAALALGEIHQEPTQVLPVLVKALGDGDPTVQRNAIWAVTAFGADGRSAAPALMREATNAASKLKWQSILALGSIKAGDEVVLGLLADTVRDPQVDWVIRNNAAVAIGEYGPAARATVPALIEALKDRQPEVRTAAGRALKQVDPEAAANAGVK